MIGLSSEWIEVLRETALPQYEIKGRMSCMSRIVIGLSSESRRKPWKHEMFTDEVQLVANGELMLTQIHTPWVFYKIM